MGTISNQYAKNIFSHQPIANWSLDDNVNFIGLLSDSQRASSNWTKSVNIPALISVSDTTSSSYPLQSSSLKFAATSIPASSASYISMIQTNSFTILNRDCSIGFWIYSDAPYISSIDIGYTNGGSPIFKTTTFSNFQPNQWVFVSQTFLMPSSSNIKPYIKVNIQNNNSSAVAFNFIINGLTFGYDSESSSSQSLGIGASQPVVSLTSKNINLSGLSGVAGNAYSYQPGTNDCYYITDGSQLFAEDASAISLVYGSKHSIELSSNNSGNNPSIIFPGFGFLNKSGQYKTYTVEFWSRIDHSINSPFRIFGPISSSDGLYIDKSFFKIKIGNNIASHYIDSWGRPMFIQIQVLKDMAILMINGEQVIKMLINSSQLSLPDYTTSNLSNDWIGFYASSDIYMFELDSFAIYPYQNSESVAKQRFIMGQGVDYPQSQIIQVGGTSTVFDYSVANYSYNYSYPQTTSWKNGVSDGLSFVNNAISFPQYELPIIVCEDITKNIISDNSSNINFLSLTPNSGYSSIDSFISFDSISPIQDQATQIWMVFSKTDSLTNAQVLFKIQNVITLEYFMATLTGTLIQYSYSINGTVNNISTTFNTSGTNKFSVGLYLKDLLTTYPELNKLFGIPSQLRLYVGGDTTLNSNTFTGNIYSINFASEKNRIKNNLTTNFSSGIIGSSGSSTTVSASTSYATYTLLPQTNLGIFGLDIATDAYWQDSVPLSTLAKMENGINSLEFIQLNIGYPETVSSNQNIVSSFGFVSTNSYSANTLFNTASGSALDLYESTSITTTSAISYKFANGTITYLPTSTNISNTSIVIYLSFSTSGIYNNPINLKVLELASQSKPANQIQTKYGIPITPNLGSNSKNPYRISKQTMPYFYMTTQSGIKLLGSETSRSLDISLNSSSYSGYSIIGVQICFKWDSTTFPTTMQDIFKVSGINQSSIQNSLTVGIGSIDSTTSADKGYLKVSSSSGISVSGFYMDGNFTNSPVLDNKQWYVVSLLFNNPVDISNGGTFSIVGTNAIFENIITLQPSQYYSTSLSNWLQVKFPQSSGLFSYTQNTWSTISASTWKTYTQNSGGNTQFTLIQPNISDLYNVFTGTNALVFDDSDSTNTELKGRLSMSKYEYELFSGSIMSSKIYLPA